MTNLKLQVLYLNESLGICINYKTSNRIIPLTAYYFWPINNLWEQVKSDLESKSWIPNEEKVRILNLIVKIMDNWQNLNINANYKYIEIDETVFCIGFS
jgi:30S ribosomal protein 3